MKVFHSFFTTKEVGKGTGLGLSMVDGFAQQSGGSVESASVAGEGTTVSIYSPRAVAETVEQKIEVDEQLPMGSASETILVVEDDDDVRAYTVGIMRELGYRVIEAYDGAAGLQLLEKQDRSVQLLLTDVIMPRCLAPNSQKLRRSISRA